MPAFFANMAESSLAMFRGFLAYDDPKTYEQIFAQDRRLAARDGHRRAGQHVHAGWRRYARRPWAGLTENGTLARSAKKTFTTPTLAAGSYQFEMTGTGDADLYVKVGREPSLTSYDCRPYKTGSNETCKVTLAQPATIGVMVNGYSTSSTFKLVGKKL